MADVHRLIDELLADGHLEGSASFSKHTYGDLPILETGRQLQERQERHRETTEQARREELRAAGRKGLRKARRARREAIRQAGLGLDVAQRPHWYDLMDDDEPTTMPKRYREMRRLEHGSGAASGALGAYAITTNRLFFQQAQLMEDFEDSYAFTGSYRQYFPTYAGMSNAQLRGYFSWRTQLRHGTCPSAPASFAFLHVYELLCGVGTTPGEQGYRDLVDFWHTFAATAAAAGTRFDAYLRQWTHDYAVYHGIPHVLAESKEGAVSRCVCTLIDAEEAVLARHGRTRKIAPATDVAMPAKDDLFQALAGASRYRLERSRMAKERPDDLHAVVADVFAALVEHCSRRRKTDFVEGLFGLPSEEPYVMFASAVFFDPQPHADAEVQVGRAETYLCHNGRWRRRRAFRSGERSRELGDILRATDNRLRERLNYPHPLKLRKQMPKYVLRLIDEAIDTHLERRRQAEARRVTIDLSRLESIRSAAAVTREALLVDEEREEVMEGPTDCGGHAGAAGRHEADGEPAAADGARGNTTDAGVLAVDAAGEPHLTVTQARVLDALLRGDGMGAEQTAREAGQLLSVITDSINETLFEMIGDAVIEFADDAPTIVADYEQDVREVLGHG